MSYSSADGVSVGFRTLTTSEIDICDALCEEAGIIIDSYNPDADVKKKELVTNRMVRRAIGDGNSSSFPIGASQGTVSALGYSQTWTLSGGTTGELYLSRLDKSILGNPRKIGFANVL